MTVYLGAKASTIEHGKLIIETKGHETQRIAADKILVSVGRKPNTKCWGLQNMAVDMNGGFVKIDSRCATSMRNIWAISDLVGEPMLEHKAAAQGKMVAEIIAGHDRIFNPVSIAAVCFTEPEIVSVGLAPTPEMAADKSIIISTLPFAANGRALSMNAGYDGGFVRVAELANEFSLVLEMGAVLEDVAGTIHVRPSLGEAFHEVTQRALGHAIHI